MEIICIRMYAERKEKSRRYMQQFHIRNMQLEEKQGTNWKIYVLCWRTPFHILFYKKV
jgi:hypothetical protein